MGSKLRMSKFSAFWPYENAISADSWIQRFKVPPEEWKFSHFWGLKKRFSTFEKSKYEGYQGSCEEIFRMYQALCEQILSILAPWKRYFWRFVNHRIECWNLIHFWGLKKRFCPVVKSTFQEYRGSYEPIFLISAAWKCDFSRLVKPTFEVTSQRVDVFFILEAWKCDFAQSWNPRFYGTKLRVSKFSACIYQASCEHTFPAFWQPENAISTESWNQRFKVPRKECGKFHFWYRKMRFCRVVKSTFQLSQI